MSRTTSTKHEGDARTEPNSVPITLKSMKTKQILLTTRVITKNEFTMTTYLIIRGCRRLICPNLIVCKIEGLVSRGSSPSSNVITESTNRALRIRRGTDELLQLDCC